MGLYHLFSSNSAQFHQQNMVLVVKVKISFPCYHVNMWGKVPPPLNLIAKKRSRIIMGQLNPFNFAIPHYDF